MIATAPSRDRNLLSVLGVAFGVAVTMGATIGAGILRTPGTIASLLGSAWAVVAIWLFGGLYALLSAVTVAELSTMIPKAGGFYVFARRAFGESAAFGVGWCDWLGNCAAIAYAAIMLGELLSPLISRMIPQLSGTVTAIAAVTILLFTGLHWTGLRAGSGAQKLTSSLIAIAFLCLITAAFFWGDKPLAAGQSLVPRSTATVFGTALGSIMIAFRTVVVAYDGWYSAIYFSEEDRNPGRNLPRSMIGGVLIVIAIYILVNLSFLRVLSMQQLAASKLPARDVANLLFGVHGGQVITILSALIGLALMNACLLSATRILFAMSRDGLFWPRAAIVSAGGTPRLALLISVGLSVALALSGTFEKLLAMAGCFYVVLHCSSFLSLFVLRRSEPLTSRPFRVWSYPYVPLFVLMVGIGSLIGSVLSDPVNGLTALILLALSYPAYLLTRRLTKRAFLIT
ncbi:MAG: amino acid permease [Acidobacteriota bacterium]|nr:amino acid permease [Acidobacteriota bacterium]